MFSIEMSKFKSPLSQLLNYHQKKKKNGGCKPRDSNINMTGKWELINIFETATWKEHFIQINRFFKCRLLIVHKIYVLTFLSTTFLVKYLQSTH